MVRAVIAGDRHGPQTPDADARPGDAAARIRPRRARWLGV